MFVPTLILSVIILGVVVLALGVRVFFHKSHRFPDTSIGHNAAMRERGIQCPRVADQLLHQNHACTHCGVDLVQRAKKEN